MRREIYIGDEERAREKERKRANERREKIREKVRAERKGRERQDSSTLYSCYKLRQPSFHIYRTPNCTDSSRPSFMHSPDTSSCWLPSANCNLLIEFVQD